VAIDNLHIEGASRRPAKAHAPLLVNADAVLAFPVAFEGFEMVTGQREVPEGRRGRQLSEFAEGSLLNIGRQPARTLPVGDLSRLVVPETLNQATILSAQDSMGK
jgi:hypothetical protein